MARIFIEERRHGDPQDVDMFRRLAALFDDPDLREPEHGPPVDVVEHEDRVEITVDLPGVPAESIRVIFAKGTVAVAGKKAPRVCHEQVAFHLAERSFGRFVRTVGLTGAFDAGRGTATLSAGELRIVLPRIDERRGRDIHIQVTRN